MAKWRKWVSLKGFHRSYREKRVSSVGSLSPCRTVEPRCTSCDCCISRYLLYKWILESLFFGQKVISCIIQAVIASFPVSEAVQQRERECPLFLFFFFSFLFCPRCLMPQQITKLFSDIKYARFILADSELFFLSGRF